MKKVNTTCKFLIANLLLSVLSTAGGEDTRIWAWDYPNILREYADYDSVVYIDPSFAGDFNNGTFDSPFLSWADVDSFFTNTAYVQKRSTVDSVGGFYVHSSNVLIGAYGEGERPIIADNESWQPFITLNGDSCILRDLELVGAVKGQYQKGISIGGAHITIYNNSIHSKDSIGNYWYYGLYGSAVGAKVLHNEIYNIWNDGVYGAGDFYEFGHNRIWNCDTKPDDGGPGDIIQFIYNGGFGYWIHDNYMEGLMIENKFALITTDAQGGNGPYGVFERNEVVMPYDRAALHVSGYLVIRNNIFRKPASSNEPSYQVHSYMGNNCEIYNNLFVDCKLYSSYSLPGIVTNNLFAKTGDTYVTGHPGSNALYTNSFGIQGDSLPVDDVFVNYGTDFRLQNGCAYSGAASDSLYKKLTVFPIDSQSLKDLSGNDVDSLLDYGPYQTRAVVVGVRQLAADNESMNRSMGTTETFLLGLSGAADVGLRVFDLTGRTVFALPSMRLEAGAHVLPSDVRLQLPPGVYSLLLGMNGTRHVQHIVVR